MKSDDTKPQPLVKPPESHDNTASLTANIDQKYRQFLPSEVVQKYLETGDIQPQDWIVKLPHEEQPWTIETRAHNALESGTRQVKSVDGYFVENAIWLHANWSLAIGIDAEIATPATLRLGGEGHRAILQQRNHLDKQWQKLQQISQQNFAKKVRSLAYLVTPGVFERKHDYGYSTCQAWPWEWKLHHTANGNQKSGQLVSVATERSVAISCRMRDTQGDSRPAPQVFAAPPGSIYYLNQPQALFQDDPNKKAHLWRKLGYSELFWVPFSN